MQFFYYQNKKSGGKELNHSVSTEQGILVAMTKQVDIPDVSTAVILLRGYADRFRVYTDFDRKEVCIDGLRKVVRHSRGVPNGHGRFHTGQELSNLLVMWIDPDDRNVMFIRVFEDSFTQSGNGNVSIVTFQKDSFWHVCSVDLCALGNAYFPKRENILASDLVYRPDLRTAFRALRYAVRN